jgi:hypothetical protein
VSGCTFPDFPRLPDEDAIAYADRWNAHQKQFRPWEQKAPAAIPEQRMPYAEEREAGCDDD